MHGRLNGIHSTSDSYRGAKSKKTRTMIIIVNCSTSYSGAMSHTYAPLKERVVYMLRYIMVITVALNIVANHWLIIRHAEMYLHRNVTILV